MNGRRPSRRLPRVAAAGLVLLVASSATPARAEPVGPDSTLREARALLAQSEPQRALTLFEQLIAADQYPVPARIGAARAAVELARPEQALSHYAAAATDSAASAADRHAALLGQANMYVWLERYPEAEATFRALIAERLDAGAREAALAGLTEALALQDHPYAAWAAHPARLPQSDPARFQKARAALWAGWPDRALPLFDRRFGFPPESRLAREAAIVHRNIIFDRGDQLGVSYRLRHDNDDLTVQYAQFEAGRHAGARHALALVGLFTRFDQHEADATQYSLQGRAATRFGDHLWLRLRGGPATIDDWHHGLWSGQAVYRPGDSTTVTLEAERALVETLPAVAARLTHASAHLRLDQLLTRTVRLSLGAFGSDFEDDNQRGGAYVELAVHVPGENRPRLRWQARFFDDSRPGNPAYFNPDSFRETRLLLDFARRLNADWRLKITAGPGLQGVEPGTTSLTTYLDGKIEAYLGRRSFCALFAGYSNSATASASGYRSVWAGLTLTSTW